MAAGDRDHLVDLRLAHDADPPPRARRHARGRPAPGAAQRRLAGGGAAPERRSRAAVSSPLQRLDPRHRLERGGADRLCERRSEPVAPLSLARFQKARGEQGRMRLGDEWLVRMPGPWDGPVRVVDVEPDVVSLRHPRRPPRGRADRVAGLRRTRRAGSAFRSSPGRGRAIGSRRSCTTACGWPRRSSCTCGARWSRRCVDLAGGRLSHGIEIETRRVDGDCVRRTRGDGSARERAAPIRDQRLGLRQPRALHRPGSAAGAALAPGPPCTPPPGWTDAEPRYRPGDRRLRPGQPGHRAEHELLMQLGRPAVQRAADQIAVGLLEASAA